MLSLILFWWILTNMANTPDWCWVIWWIMVILNIFQAIAEFIKLGMKLGK